jgi:SepF-like predicted cell division protein (DUF552 family)
MKNFLKFAGELDLEVLEITSMTSGVVIDISMLFMEINLFESLDSNTIGGHVTVNESLDIVSHLPLVGEEMLRIKYKTPTFSNDDEVSKTFVIYKVSDRHYSASTAQAYTIYFMSVESYFDMNTKLSRAYNGQLSYIANQLFSTYDGLNSDKDLFLEETDNAFRFIVPMWSPIKTLNYIATRSVSKKYKTANYIFYEDMYQYNFRSISSLIDTTQPFMYYQYNELIPRNAREMDIKIDPFTIIKHFSIPLDFDITQRQLMGFYSSRILNYDIMSKRLNIKDLDYFNTFNDRPHLDGKNSYPVSTRGTMRDPNAFVKFYPTNSYMFDDYDTDNPLSWVIQRNMLMQELELHKIQITVPGRSDMTVGKVIYIEYNTVQSHHDMIDSKENLYTGNYLVTAINHRMSLNEHEMIISCVKDNVIRNLEAI